MKFSKNILFMLFEKNFKEQFNIAQIMEITGLSRSSIIVALKSLIWEGRISVSEMDRPHSPGKKMNTYKWKGKNPSSNTCSMKVKGDKDE